MRILFDSRQTQYKTPFGTLRTGECCVLQIRIPTEVGASGVRLMLEDSEHAVCAELPFSFASRGEDGYELWRLEFTRQETGLHFYWFRIDKRDGGSFRLFRQGRDTNMEAGEKWQLSVIPADFRVPDFAPGAVMYQIFPDRFARSGSSDLTGKLQPWVSGKDVILHLIGLIGVDGALYQSLEYCGDGVAALSMDDRLCIANMSIEAGAKNGIFPVDAITRAYLDGRVNRPYTAYEADPDAEYVRTVEIDLSQIEPTVAFPHLPENAHPISEVGQIKIDQVVIGSCTNGRLEDMAVAAQILKGKKVADHVRCIVMPATQHIFKQCIELGYMTTFIDAGCAVSTPTCGPCLGGHMGVMADGEKCVATTNRNFVGRMGGITSEIYLASPAVAAASAVAGYIADPRN